MAHQPVVDRRHRSDQQRLLERAASHNGARKVHGAFSPSHNHLLISVAAGTTMLAFGYEQGVLGGILVGDEFKRFFDNPSPAMVGFVTSIYDLGCFAGALLTLGVGERLGRKRMLIVFTTIMTTGVLVQTGAQSINQMLWGRLIAGLGNGGNTATAPVWHVETAAPAAKGQAVVKDMTLNVLGFVIANVITLACSDWTSDSQWRFPLGIQVLFFVTVLVLVPLLPESPRWLLSRDRDAEAMTALTHLSEHDVQEEFEELRDSVREEMAAQATWKQIMRGGTPTRRLLLGMMLQVCQQMSGINLYCYFLPYVLHESVGLPETAARWLATFIAILYTIATGASFFLVERLGRRKLLMWLSGALSIACIGVAISSELESKESALIPGIVAAVFMTLYFIAFGLGWVAVPWLYPAEINSLSMRTKGASLATACDWIFNWLVVQTTPLGIYYLKWGVYLVYAVFNLSFIPLIYYFVVETSGLSLEQIDQWFVANPGWRVDKARVNPLQMMRARDSLDEDAERVGLVKKNGKGADDDGDVDVRGFETENSLLSRLADSDEEREEMGR